MLKRLILTTAMSLAALSSAWAEDKLPVTGKTCSELLAFYKNLPFHIDPAVARWACLHPREDGRHHGWVFADGLQSSLAHSDAGRPSSGGLPPL